MRYPPTVFPIIIQQPSLAGFNQKPTIAINAAHPPVTDDDYCGEFVDVQ